MQNKTFYKFLNRLLKSGKINASKVSQMVKNSPDFENLINSGFIGFQSATTGGGSYIIIDKTALRVYFEQKFPQTLQSTSAIGNVKAFRNTKAGKRENQNVILLRGFKEVELNGEIINLEYFTKKFNTFSAKLQSLNTPKVCFVENLDSYLLAEQVIDSDYVFIHTYGGLGKTTIEKINSRNVLIFPDYDYIGLHNYLKIKKIISHTKLFIPKNYELLFKDYSREIKTKNGREQTPSKEVKASQDESVIRIKNSIYTHKRFLEQQALFNEKY